MSTRNPGPLPPATSPFAAATHNEVTVQVGEHYSGGRALRIVFGSDHSAHTTAEVMSDAGEIRQLALELLAAANYVDGA